MAYLRIEDLSFSYAGADGCGRRALEGVSFEAERGSITVICGASGSGKTTLLRLLKPSIAPGGDMRGSILLDGTSVGALSAREQASRIGFVTQSPDAQICSDTVLGELAFGLENIGCPREEMRARIAEVALFFGLYDMLHARTIDLSGGEKQLLNLASVTAMRPTLLVLDEPLAQLDPIMRGRFMDMIVKLNQELGITLVIAEHQLDALMSIADSVVVLDEGSRLCCGAPADVARESHEGAPSLSRMLPAATRIFLAVEDEAPSRGASRPASVSIPFSVREGRDWLEAFAHGMNSDTEVPDDADACARTTQTSSPILQMTDVRFRYDRQGDDVLADCSLSLFAGEVTALLGGNGAGKSTLLKALSGKIEPYMGSIRVNGTRMKPKALRSNARIAYLPQDATLLFTGDTVEAELGHAGLTILSEVGITALDGVQGSDPFDLSIGQQQALALAKVLATDTDIILLDEPTKGMDLDLRTQVQQMIEHAAAAGASVLIATHDIDLAAECACHCAMMLDGALAICAPTRSVLEENFLYTTAARRMSAGIFPHAITPEEVIACCRKMMPES